MPEKLALLRIAFCRAPAFRRISPRRRSVPGCAGTMGPSGVGFYYIYSLAFFLSQLPAGLAVGFGGRQRLIRKIEAKDFPPRFVFPGTGPMNASNW